MLRLYNLISCPGFLSTSFTISFHQLPSISDTATYCQGNKHHFSQHAMCTGSCHRGSMFITWAGPWCFNVRVVLGPSCMRSLPLRSGCDNREKIHYDSPTPLEEERRTLWDLNEILARSWRELENFNHSSVQTERGISATSDRDRRLGKKTLISEC